MLGRKKRESANETPPEDRLAHAFAGFNELNVDDIALFEFLLLGGVVEAVRKLSGRTLIGEKDASDVFATLPTAVLMTKSAGRSVRSTVPAWDAAGVPGLVELRSRFPEACAVAAADPALLMAKLVPRFQSELSHYAPNQTGQVRSCWVWAMATLSWHTIPPPEFNDLIRIYGSAVQRWESAMHETYRE